MMIFLDSLSVGQVNNKEDPHYNVFFHLRHPKNTLENLNVESI